MSMKRPERQPGVAPEEDFCPSKKGVAGVLAASALLTLGVVEAVDHTMPTPVETVAVVPHACEVGGESVPYDVQSTEDNVVSMTSTTEDLTVLGCPEGSLLNTERVKVNAASGDAAAIPNSTEISFGNTHGDPVLDVSVDEEAGTVTVTTDSVARIEKIDGVQR